MPFGAYGIRRLLDANQRFCRGGLSVYLRTKTFTDNPVITATGLTFVPTTPNTPVGTRDTLITPPPEIKLINMHSLAMAIASGVQLRQGARKVTVSHTWVRAIQIQQNYSDPKQVFNDPSVVGFVSDGLLMEVVDIIHKDAFGEIIEWVITCNTSELSAA